MGRESAGVGRSRDFTSVPPFFGLYVRASLPYQPHRVFYSIRTGPRNPLRSGARTSEEARTPVRRLDITSAGRTLSTAHVERPNSTRDPDSGEAKPSSLPQQKVREVREPSRDETAMSSDADRTRAVNRGEANLIEIDFGPNPSTIPLDQNPHGPVSSPQWPPTPATCETME